MSDLPFGIETKNTYAALTPADLQSMGKQAAAAYLCGGTPLNDTIIKLARCHPSISPHQVQRVVEYANQETFAKLFSDNEKYASDKNIEFDVADPGDVLLELNNGAKPHIMTADPSDYSSGPVKLGHSDVEADLELCRMFGVEPVPPGMEKQGRKARWIMDQAAKYTRNPEHAHEGALAVHKLVTKQLGGQRAAKDISKLRGWAGKGGPVRKAVARAGERALAKGTAKFGSALDRILSSGEEVAQPDHSLLPNNEGTQARGSLTHDEEAQKTANMGMLPPGEGAHDPMAMPAGAGSGEDQGGHHEQMLEVQREIELAKKRQELQKIQQTTLDAMNPQGPPGGVSAPAPGMDPAAAGPQAGGPPAGPPAGAPPAPPGGAPVEMAPMPPEQQMPPPAAGAITAPPGAAMPKMGSAPIYIEGSRGLTASDVRGLPRSAKAGGRKFGWKTFPKGTSLVASDSGGNAYVRKGGKIHFWDHEIDKLYPVAGKSQGHFKKFAAAALANEALDYAKEGRPHTELVLDDLASATSLERIKEASAARPEYPAANPYGELIRTKQKLAKLLDDATYARGKNEELHKEATARFQKTVVQHMYDGGNLAEVAHLMSAVHGEPVSVKTAMSSAMEELTRHGIDPVKAQVDAIQYEMVKGASVRAPNLEHPIAQAYADLHKLADGGHVLDRSWSQIKGQYDRVESVLREAMAHAASC